MFHFIYWINKLHRAGVLIAQLAWVNWQEDVNNKFTLVDSRLNIYSFLTLG